MMIRARPADEVRISESYHIPTSGAVSGFTKAKTEVIAKAFPPRTVTRITLRSAEDVSAVVRTNGEENRRSFGSGRRSFPIASIRLSRSRPLHNRRGGWRE